MTKLPGVICISRAAGAGGEVVGRIVSEQLGFRYVDEEIVERAARSAKVPVSLVADAEVRKSLVARLLPQIGSDVAAVSMMGGVTPPINLDASDDYRELIKQAVREVAEQGRCVIVAHAASHVLGPESTAFRVLVTAPPEVRAERLADELGVRPGEAKKIVVQSDRDRADYFKRFHHAEELPTDYDLVVNTSGFSPEQAAQLVVAACGTPAEERS